MTATHSYSGKKAWAEAHAAALAHKVGCVQNGVRILAVLVEPYAGARIFGKRYGVRYQWCYVNLPQEGPYKGAFLWLSK